MKIAIRTDASIQIGSGHLMRCLTLAEGLREQGAEVLFVCRELPGNLNDLIAEKGFDLCQLPAPDIQNITLDWNQHASWLGVPWQQDAEETKACLEKKATDFNWLIVDHYALDKNWQSELRSLVDKVMVIDDLADRQHDCDLLLDQNLYADMDLRYQGLLPEYATKLNGPQWALLRREFQVLRERDISRDGQLRRLFVFLGGSDLGNITSMVLNAISRLEGYDFNTDVIVGVSNPNRSAVEKLCKRMPNVNFYCQVTNISEFMVNADLAIGAGGSASWERCSVKLPALIVSIAENQISIAQAIHDTGAAIFLGNSDAVNEDKICAVLKRFFASASTLKEMGERAGELVDAQGTKRVVKKMLSLI